MDLPATWLLLREMRANVRMPAERLAVLQDRLTREAVAHAGRHVPFYRRYWRERGFEPSSFRGRADWTRVPIVDMGAAKQAARDGELIDERLDTRNCTYIDSSGSSGAVTRIWKQPLEERVRRAGGLRIWFEHGFRWRDRTAQFQILRGPQLWLQQLGVARKTWISTADPIEVQMAQFLAADAGVVVGTPTALRAICAAIARTNATPRRPRIVFGAGELLDHSTREAVERVLGVSPVGLYGQTEVGYAAFQCESGKAFHWAADTHFVEILRQGEAAPAGELGRLVITDLRSRAMPFLRCDTGDLARAARGPCNCGRMFPALEAMEGRARGTLVLPSGAVLTTRAVLAAMTTAVALGRFRIAQAATAECRITFLIGVPPVQRTAAVQSLRALTNGAVAIIEDEAPAWPPDNTGKTHSVSSDAVLPRELSLLSSRA